MRKEHALRVLEFIEGGRDPAQHEARLSKLDSLTDSFALRIPGRQLVVRASWWKRVPKMMSACARANSPVLRTRGSARTRGRSGTTHSPPRFQDSEFYETRFLLWKPGFS